MRDEALEPIWGQQQVILNCICGLRATTPQAIFARVDALCALYGGNYDDESNCVDDRLLAAICRDADTLGGRASASQMLAMRRLSFGSWSR